MNRKIKILFLIDFSLKLNPNKKRNLMAYFLFDFILNLKLFP